jgi:hypothetical protein
MSFRNLAHDLETESVMTRRLNAGKRADKKDNALPYASGNSDCFPARWRDLCNGDLVPVGYRSGTAQPCLPENSVKTPFTNIEGFFRQNLAGNFMTF